MSVLFLPPSAGAASVPDATETVSGKIRIATSAEATAGTLDTAAMTPLKVKSVVDSAIVGGVTYQGTFDTSSPVDLSNAEKGDLYIISVAGTYQGITWAVGDHLLVNADMGGTISPSKIDKVDNTDAVTSVAGRTGAVTLSASDVSGLAAVATSGAYSDLSGTPTNVSSFTNDAGYLTSAPVDSVAGKTGAVTLELDDLTDVTISTPSAGESIVYNGTLSAFQNATISGGGSSFFTTSVASSGPVAQITTNRRQHYNALVGGITITIPAAGGSAAGGVYSVRNSASTAITVNCPTTAILSGSSVTSYTVAPYEVRAFLWIGTSQLQELVANRLEHLNDVSLSSLSGGDAVIYNGTLSAFQNSTLATVATSGAYSDLSGTPTNVSTFTNDAGYLTSVPVDSVASKTGAVTLDLDDLEDVTITSAAAGEAIVYNGTLSVFENATISAGVTTLGALTDVTITSVSAGDTIIYNGTLSVFENSTLATVATSGAYSDLSGTPTNVSAFTNDSGYLTSAPVDSVAGKTGVVTLDLDDLTDVTISGVSAGESIVYNGTLSAFQNATISGGGGGGSTLPTVTTQTTSYIIPSRTAGQLNLVVLVNNGASAVTIDLPSIASGDVGFMIDIKVLGTGTVTVDAGSNYIDDGAAHTLNITTQYDSRTFVAGTTTDWYII